MLPFAYHAPIELNAESPLRTGLRQPNAPKSMLLSNGLLQFQEILIKTVGGPPTLPLCLPLGCHPDWRPASGGFFAPVMKATASDISYSFGLMTQSLFPSLWT